MKKNISSNIFKEKNSFNKFLKKLLSQYLSNNYLDRVILYGSLNGGKRIRPYLVKEFAKIKKIKPSYYKRLSASIELIHCYSLIHDDLPSMDNDDFRRGKPSVHKKFDEAQAILAGDSLHDLAFEILSSKKTHPNSKIRLQLIKILSKSLGSKGLAGGQSLDLLYEKKSTTLKKIQNMYEMKTGELFKFCCQGPFIMSRSNSKEIEFANDYGKVFGLIFQIVDDYMDITGEQIRIGKTPGKDKEQGKNTILKYFNNRDIDKFCKKIVDDFISNNKYYFKKWPRLKDVLFYFVRKL